jgi:hypothetical protein
MSDFLLMPSKIILAVLPYWKMISAAVAILIEIVG